MLYQQVNFQKTGNIVIIDIIGPLDKQAKLVRLSEEISGFCAEIVWDQEVRVIVITGAGEKSFSVGTDLFEGLLKGNGRKETIFWSLAEPIAKLDKPVIAAINGDATGQGLELVLACDVRIATETSHFGLPHIKAGLIPWDGGTQRSSRLVGRGRALEMILTGEMIDAKEALQIGLISRVVSEKELMKVTMEMGKEMASKGPIALRYTKEAIYKGMDMTLEQGLRLEADLYLLIHTSKDRTEGIQAFREKRAPKFEGK